ncbi:ABC transporter substrate-binding protein [Halorhabdus sp. CUG00001]|uniref:ABC transporter substrate-binding protein n=1 Tax=Halorhabdus sp. CUG00001 TaxID=2600297 RepID=UPI001E4CA7CD|nr:ABC transporter substrate-binding protein [Halorhabdus sp. CUG00001]
MSRRGLLAAFAAASSSGCLQRARTLVNRRSPEQVSVTIKTVPADDDEASVEIARRFQEHMAAVGINATINLQDEAVFLRDVVLNNDFDVYVGRFPPRVEPDFLRATLHSQFVSEPGWQNPFGLSDLELDEALSAQRTLTGSSRRRTIEEIATSIATIQPLLPICFPTESIVVQTDRFEGWPDDGQLTPLDYLHVQASSDGTASDVTRLAVSYTDARITQSLNPIAVEYRRRGTITGLLYDSLARRHDGTLRPWLASRIDWETETAKTTATISLRDGATWHDGRSLTASDVAFTYRFFDDTTLGDGDVSVPAPRFRGRTSLVESATTVDNTTVRLSFGETSQTVAERAFTVPVLPEHVWEDKTGSADLAGVDVSTAITEALVWPNIDDPVGSGPLQFESRQHGDELVLSTFENHFRVTDPPSWFDAEPAFDELLVRIAPSETAAITLVTEGQADATGTPVRPAHDVAPTDAVETSVGTSRSFYHVGYNTTVDPFGNVRFRRLLSQLLDPSSIVDTVLGGDGIPAATPLAGTEWTPSEPELDGTDPVAPFLGTDGELDESAARDAFREAGFRYDGDRLVR